MGPRDAREGHQLCALYEVVSGFQSPVSSPEGRTLRTENWKLETGN
jgi:hypothetical protein